MDGGTLEYIFETDEQDVPKTVSKEKAAEIAADFVTTFYHAQIGALETQEFRTQPVPFWLVSFSDTTSWKSLARSRVSRGPWAGVSSGSAGGLENR